MRCPNCDRENRGIARFCQYCGAPLAAQALEREPQPPDAEPTPKPAGETPSSVPLPELDEQREESPVAPQKEEPRVVEKPQTVEPAPMADKGWDATSGEAMAAEAGPQETPLHEAGVHLRTAEGEPSVPEQSASSGEVHPDDLAPDDVGATGPDAELSPDESAPDTRKAFLTDTGSVRPETQLSVSGGGGESVDEDGTQSESGIPVQEDILPFEGAALDSQSELEEYAGPEEPLVQVQDLAAAGMLPWDDRGESEQVPLTTLEPGTIVDGRYKVIEVVQAEEQENWYSVRDLVRCPRCGSTDNSPDEAFCVSCGALMEQKPVATMLERAAPGEVEPDNAQAADFVRYQDRDYWVWQEMEQEQLDAPLPMHMVVGQLSDTGQVRELDEDSLFVLTMASTYEATPHRLGLFVVADGMGGHAGGEVASRVAIQHLAQSIVSGILAPELTGSPLAQAAIPDQLEKAVHAANDRVYLERQKRGNDMGTTLTVALVVDWTLYLAHVGDCRAYRWGQEGLQQLTTDHSIVAGMVAACTMEPDEIYTHPQRSVIYRSIGDHPAVDVDLSELELLPDDRLVICSDGLWEMIRNEGIEDVLLREADPQAACEIMVEQANRAGGSDNISVIIVQF